MSTLPETGEKTQLENEKHDPFHIGCRYVKHEGPDGEETWTRVPLRPEDLLHPQEYDSLVQTFGHGRDCRYLQTALELRVGSVSGMKVLGDWRVDWGVPGIEPHGPDLAVFADVQGEWQPDKGTFYVRDHQARPVLIIEVTSHSTRDVDLIDKVPEYYRAGVPLYAIVDRLITKQGLEMGLLGYRATPSGYVRIDLDDLGRLWLDSLRVWLALDGDRVAVLDEKGNRIPDYGEVHTAAQEAEDRAETESKARQEAEKARQEAMKLAATQASARQEAEQQARDLQARMAEMEAELHRLRGGS